LEARFARLERQLTEHEGRTFLDTDALGTGRQGDDCIRTDVQPGGMHTSGIGNVAENRNHGSGEDEEGIAPYRQGSKARILSGFYRWLSRLKLRELWKACKPRRELNRSCGNERRSTTVSNLCEGT
jgi:hypothetical protein